jgi:hypothetical protein
MLITQLAMYVQASRLTLQVQIIAADPESEGIPADTAGLGILSKQMLQVQKSS